MHLLKKNSSVLYMRLSIFMAKMKTIVKVSTS